MQTARALFNSLTTDLKSLETQSQTVKQHAHGARNTHLEKAQTLENAITDRRGSALEDEFVTQHQQANHINTVFGGVR